MRKSAVGHAGASLRWGSQTLVEQMANVGSEVERALRARDSGRASRLENAVTRALELFDLTATDARWQGHRRREILRAREEFCRILYGDDSPPGSADGLRRYFLQFAVAARNPLRPTGSAHASG